MFGWDPFEACGCYSVTFLDRTPMFDWCKKAIGLGHLTKGQNLDVHGRPSRGSI